MEFDLSYAFDRLNAMLEQIVAAIPSIILASFIFILFYIVAKLFRSLAKRASERRGHTYGAGLAVGRIVQGVIILVGLLIALSIVLPTFHPGDIVEILGIGGIAIGFAFRDILQNFLAGILLLFTQPFRIGDQIITGSYEGTVEEIQTRATFIRTYDGRRVVIPNAVLFTQSVTVNTAFEVRRIDYDIGIGYGDDIARAKQLILETLQRLDIVLEDPAPDVLVMRYEPSSITLRARWWIQPPRYADALDSRDTVLEAVRIVLKGNGIDMPFPTQQVLFHDQTEESDGDRARQREGWPAGKGELPKPRSIAGALRTIADAVTQKGEQKK